jgi:hypothetical protein
MIAAVQGLARAYLKRLEYVGALSEEIDAVPQVSLGAERRGCR